MNWAYTATIYLAVFTLAIMILIVKNNDLLSGKKKKQFITIFSIMIIAAMSEWLALFLNGKDSSLRWLHIIARSMDHSLAPIVAVVFCVIIDAEQQAKRLILPMIVHTILEILSGYFGFIYYVDGNNIYHHGSMYWIYVAFYLICSIYFILQDLKFGMKYQNCNGVMLWLLLIYIFSGVVIGMIRSDIHIAYICLSVAMVLAYIYFIEVVEKTDGLTGLLNRHSYKEAFRHQNEKAVVLFFDVDDFKFVNDHYGHLYGDECLKKISKIILQTYSEKGYCYRIGGDEFCVILKKGLDQVEKLNQKFVCELSWHRKNDVRIPFVSVGYAMFDPQKTDMETCIKEADTMMYEWKNKKKMQRNMKI